MLKQQHKNWVSQKWWERKENAYSRIVESLWHLLEYAREAQAALESERYGGSGPGASVEHNFSQNRAELEKLADIGAFVISKDVANALSEYMTATHPQKLDLEYVEIEDVIQIHLEATEKCLEKVRIEAARDLKIT